MKRINFLIILFLTLSTEVVFAGPTIIRDSRITDTAITPVLGRGYSVGTNTFQSTCLRDVVITEPSYDLNYSFDSMTESSSTTSTSSTDTASSSSSTSKSSGKSKWKNNWWGKRNTSSEFKRTLTRIQKTAGSSQVTASGTKYKHSIIVTIVLTTYYASVDESQSMLTESAVQLLTNKDIPGFFSSCGPYYVRSLGREAIFLSEFSYVTETTERDSSFESMIENQLKGFRSYSRDSSAKYWGVSKSSEYDSSYSFDNSSSIESKNTFNEQAESKKLTITTHAFGLGRRSDSKIISYDIDTFKEAIQEAFISMQNHQTGKVVNMEVVPWVENTQFQNLIELESTEEIVEKIRDENGTVLLDTDGNERTRTLPPKIMFEKKMLLNENAEFIIEIDRVDRNIMNMYYKARLCRRNIDMNWKSDGELRTDDYGDPLYIQNKRYLDQSMLLSDLDTIVSSARVDEIYDAHTEFMYGVADKEDGASVCMKRIMEVGIFNKSYRDITECQDVFKNMGLIQNDTIENYCMPEVVE